MAPSKRKKWSKEAMIAAVEAVNNKEMGYLKASKKFGVPKGTLARYVKDHRSAETLTNVKLGRRPVLAAELEEKLVEYCLLMTERYFGLRCSDIKHMAFQLALKNGLSHPFNCNKRTAGMKWLRGFLKRHPQLLVERPEDTTSASDEHNDKFYDIYESELSKINNSPQRLFCVDETGITIVPEKNNKVIALKGKKQISSLMPEERSNLITIVSCVNAVGSYVPPLIVFPQKDMYVSSTEGYPPGAVWVCHRSGYIQTEIFIQWFQHFIRVTKPTESDPVLLILDGHFTHSRNVEIIDMAKKHHVLVVCLPPNATYRMHPLNLGFMSLFKMYYAREIEMHLTSDARNVISNSIIMRLFSAAYKEASTVETSVNAFKQAGLFPCTRQDVDLDNNIPVVVVLPKADKPGPSPTKVEKVPERIYVSVIVAKAKTNEAQTENNVKRKTQDLSEEESADDDEPFLPEFDDGEDCEDDVECVNCTYKFSEDTQGEKWAKCAQCFQWSHEHCGEIKDSAFLCSFCVGIQ